MTRWTRRARLAARRAQRLARTGAIRVQRAAGELADKFRKRGREAAAKDVAVMEMAGLDEVRGGKLLQRSVEATVNRGEARKPGPLPDPAWTAGYRDVVAAKVPGLAREPVAAAVPAEAGPAEAGEARPSWPEAPEGSGWPFGPRGPGADDQLEPDGPEAGS